MAGIKDSLNLAMKINGTLGVAIVDFFNGLCLGHLGGDGSFDLELAAAGMTDVVKAQKNIRNRLKLQDRIEDMLITLDNQYHLIRVLKDNEDIFFYLILDRKTANLALARMELRKIEKDFKL